MLIRNMRIIETNNGMCVVNCWSDGCAVVYDQNPKTFPTTSIFSKCLLNFRQTIWARWWANRMHMWWCVGVGFGSDIVKRKRCRWICERICHKFSTKPTRYGFYGIFKPTYTWDNDDTIFAWSNCVIYVELNKFQMKMVFIHGYNNCDWK